MAGNVKLMTSAGGGVVLDTATTTATDVTVKVPVTGVNNGTLVCSDSSGNVGIGTSSPGTKLDVNGIIRAGAGAGGAGGYKQLYSADPASRSWWLSADVNAYGDFCFQQSTTQTGSTYATKMMLDSSGNLLVGTTTYAGSFSGYRIHVKGTNAGIGIVATNNGDYGIGFNNASNTLVGNVTINSSSTAYNTSSDYRLKENIQPMQNALSTVAQLNPVTYTWKADGSDGQGFIAHELQAVVPDCVTGEKDAVDAEGKPVYQGIDTSFLVATLTKAIQEQQAQIETLTAKVAALEAK